MVELKSQLTEIHYPQPDSGYQFKRPSLEYRHAFDWCAVKTISMTDSLVIFSSHSFYTFELLNRLSNLQITVVPTSNWPLEHTCLVRTEDHRFSKLDFESIDTRFGDSKVIVWAEPDFFTGKSIAQKIYQFLNLDGFLFVLGSGYLSNFLPEWRGNNPRKNHHSAGVIRCRNWLRKTGFEILECYGFRNPASFLLGIIGRLLSEAGRKDLADSCYIKIRKRLVFRGLQAIGSPVYMIIAKKGRI